MKLAPIFVNNVSKEGLYAIWYDDADCDEFVRLFELWNDAVYVHDYLRANARYLNSEYFRDMYPDEIFTEILDEAEELELLLEEYTQQGFEKCGSNLQTLFRPLNNQVFINPPALERNKASINDRHNFPKDILRVYALRLGENTFVITGGAIKLVHRMEDHDDTRNELRKLELAREWLRKKGFNTTEDLYYYG
jgi:hypothetical protein